ncbi:actin nucleation-promoting factor WASL-like [Pseudophryne corroboree]|uniref:actin nucleation-promoting factor WASL-like n=1 Tax=Pseudophryne corroboree TaxID=495146 RepID=UPI0030817852
MAHRARRFSSKELKILVRHIDRPLANNAEKLAAYECARQEILSGLHRERGFPALQRRWSDLVRREQQTLQLLRAKVARECRPRLHPSSQGADPLEGPSGTLPPLPVTGLQADQGPPCPPAPTTTTITTTQPSGIPGPSITTPVEEVDLQGLHEGEGQTWSPGPPSTPATTTTLPPTHPLHDAGTSVPSIIPPQPESGNPPPPELRRLMSLANTLFDYIYRSL